METFLLWQASLKTATATTPLTRTRNERALCCHESDADQEEVDGEIVFVFRRWSNSGRLYEIV